MRAEGRGKLSTSQKTYTFSYELDIDDKKFLLGVDFPFYREEFLKINFKTEGVKVEGSLYKRLLKNLDNNSRLFSELKEFFSSWGHLLLSIRKCRNNVEGRECFFANLDDKRWTVKDGGKRGRLMFTYFPHLDKDHGIIFDNFKIKEGYFNRQKIDIRFSVGRMTMEFFINSCPVD